MQNSPHNSRATERRGRSCFYAFCSGRHRVRSACRVSTPAFWASWADTLPVIVGRHPRVVRHLVGELEHKPQTHFLQAAEMARRQLNGVMGFEPPSWEQQLRGHDHHSGNPTTSSQALCDLVGNTKPVPGRRNGTGRTCSPGCLNRCRHWCAPKQVLEQEWH